MSGRGGERNKWRGGAIGLGLTFMYSYIIHGKQQPLVAHWYRGTS